ncbi:Uncharacterised protein [Vibrio cholerae]|nr:Uncharacterised protein [Vibrio cholerae]CSI65545.1 Uncharacterised protein [Vibrio cholerae]
MNCVKQNVIKGMSTNERKSKPISTRGAWRSARPMVG